MLARQNAGQSVCQPVGWRQVSSARGCVDHLIGSDAPRPIIKQLCSHRFDCMQLLRSLQGCDVLVCTSSRFLHLPILRPRANKVSIRSFRIVTTMVPGPAQSAMSSEPDLPRTSELLPCQLDSYARSGTATVLACEAVALPSKPAKAGKAAKKGASTGVVGSGVAASNGSDQSRLWCVTLDGGPLYPEGGGQPSDTGTLQIIGSAQPPHADDADGDNAAPAEAADAIAGGPAAAQNASMGGNAAAQPVAAAVTTAPAAEKPAVAVNVLSVARSGSRIMATVDAPLAEGVTVAISVDWDRRLDLMQQHTGWPPPAPRHATTPPRKPHVQQMQEHAPVCALEEVALF